MTPYEQLLARLLPARRFGVVLGLERMHAIFERLGHPEHRLGRVVHVGGTNGKGSTVRFIADLLRATGSRVATYTSPHLSCLRERICLGSQLISEDEIVAAADRVRAAGGDELTFFEQLTAIACVAIAAWDVDVTVLEVGLGGRLDATNAVRAEVAVVTGVAMDHAAILGDTLAKIALEKAGIFKPHQRVVIGVSGEPAAVPVLIDAAQRALARLSIVGEHDLAKVRSHRGWRHGEVQQRNAANAIVAVAALDQGAAAFELAALNPPPGRFEVIEEDDLDLVLDGAHNPHAAAALAGELRARGIEPVVIIAASSDKDVAGIAAALAPVARGVIATRYQQDRAMAPDALAAIMRTAVGSSAASHAVGAPAAIGIEIEGAPSLAAPARDLVTPSIRVETAPTLAAALARVRDPAGPFYRGASGSVIHPRPEVVITGSLFLVGEARTLLLGAPTDPYVVTDPPATP